MTGNMVKALLLAALLLLAGCSTEVPDPAPSAVSCAPVPVHSPAPGLPSPEDFVLVTQYISPLYVDLKYAGSDNFTGQTIYSFSQPWLRYGTVVRLTRAAELLAQEGFALLLWDAFRPVSAQFRLWEACPDPNYVANPIRGHSAHSRGNTVDVTLVTLAGEPVTMPTGFDDFSPAADRNYTDVSPEAAAHARLLEQIMEQCGFRPYAREWWHYSDIDAYPVDETFSPKER